MAANQYRLVLETDNFRLLQVASCVYAALEKENATTGSNAAFVDLGDQVVVYDSFLNLDAAVQLRDAVRLISGKEPTYVINSHMHLDHVVGNQVFGRETAIATSVKVRDAMLTDTAQSLASMQARDANVIGHLEQGIRLEQDPEKLANMKNSLKFLKNVMRPDLQLRYPNLTFDHQLTIHGKHDELRLTALDIAHSPGDVYGYLPGARVCMAGDLIFAGEPPWIGAGNPTEYLKAWERLLELDADCFISGHGPLATKAEIRLQIKYLSELLTLVGQRLEAGDRCLKRDDFSPEFRAWGGPVFQWNIDWTFGWLSKVQQS
ncbi:MAG: MBL fold metallo-hydrolase [Bacillota bacterium]